MKEHYLCLDLEMSGVVPGTHDIIQIAAVLLDEDFKILSEYESLVFPMYETTFDPESKKIHGISRSQLNDAPAMEEVLDELEYWLREEGGYSSRRSMQQLKICGQGINNDISFLKDAYHTVQMSWPFAHQFIDLQDIALYYNRILKANGMKPSKGVNLSSVAKRLDLSRAGDQHHALEDVRLTAQCLSKLFRKAKEIKL
ncbi:MAG: exonuclease domain-containing protein [Mangrovibacterium sp.]